MLRGGSFFSIGSAASRVGTVVSTFRRQAGKLGQRPALEIDGVPLYTGDQVDKIGRAIEQQIQKSDAGCDPGKRSREQSKRR